MIHFHDLANASAEQIHDWLEAIANDMRPADLDELRAINPKVDPQGADSEDEDEDGLFGGHHASSPSMAFNFLIR